MTRKPLLPLLIALACVHGAAFGQRVVVIGHAGVDKLDALMVQRIFTGRVVEIGGLPLTPINFASGNPLRTQFLQTFLKQDEERYVAYWTVRRYIGKGVPPREFANPADVIRFVQTTPGAIGYVDESSVTTGMNVLAR